MPVNHIQLSFKSHLRNQRLTSQSKSINTFRLSHSLTHAGYDAVHRELAGSVQESPGAAALPLLLVEDEGGVLLLGDVDVVAGVVGGHDVARAGVQQDALVVFPLYTDQTHAVPARHIPAVSRHSRKTTEVCHLSLHEKRFLFFIAL